MMHRRALLAFTLVLCAAPGPLAAADGKSEISTVRGAGSTFVYPLLRLWARSFYQQHETEIVFEPVGSSAGLDRLNEGRVSFAASDRPLSREELDAGGYLQFPIVVGGIVPVVNLLLEPGGLVLSGPVLADIYRGEIERWNDDAIAELNPGVRIPDAPITVVYRGDRSGTTYNLTDYLAKVSEPWREQFGATTSPGWRVGVPALGNAGVAELVGGIANSIGYVNYAYALTAKLNHARMINRSGQTVRPTMGAFRSAAAGVDYASAASLSLTLTDRPDAQAWPIVATTYVVMRARPASGAASAATLGFIDWCYRNGGSAATELNYVALPAEAQALVRRYWSANLRVAGKPLWGDQQIAE